MNALSVNAPSVIPGMWELFDRAAGPQARNNTPVGLTGPVFSGVLYPLMGGKSRPNMQQITWSWKTDSSIGLAVTSLSHIPSLSFRMNKGCVLSDIRIWVSTRHGFHGTHMMVLRVFRQN